WLRYVIEQRYVIEHIQDWPANRVRDLLPWKVDLSSQ
ncbi:transposase domain-containing protein, partial [Escherichia coli]